MSEPRKDQEPGASSTGRFEAPEPEKLDVLLPGYKVTRMLACGELGAVYRAWQESMDREVAIRILPAHLGAEASFRERFESGAKAMARVHHPNLIAVHEFGEAGDFLYVVMDFVEGKSLSRFTRGKAIGRSHALPLIRGICAGIAHAHEEDIIHRNLGPANILVDSREHPRIGGFGLVRSNSAEYIAPEVRKDPNSASKRSDVYSLGVIFHELLTSELPGDRYSPLSKRSNVDCRFDLFVGRALNLAAAMRQADAGRMMAELEALEAAPATSASSSEAGSPGGTPATPKLRTGGLPTAPRPAPAVLVKAPAGRQQRALVRAFGVLAIVLVAAGLVWLVYHFSKNAPAQPSAGAGPKLQKSAEKEDSITNRPRERVVQPRSLANPDSSESQPTESFSLEELRESLARGERSEFPAGTWEVGQARVFLVKDRMTWREARRFAEQHGAHLATIADEAAKNAITARLAGNYAVWLGGGTTGPSRWGWVDGSSWRLSAPPTNPDGRYLQLTREGNITSNSGTARRSFLIQWQPNGENPASIDAQLKRVSKSLAGGDPIYPPGTLSHHGRRYWIAETEVGWEEAVKLAETGGGHLAVPGDQAESDFLRNALSQVLPGESAAWLGGQFRDGSWTWITGETWSFSAWGPKPPHLLDPTGTAICLVGGREGGWDNAHPEEGNGAVTALIVEWSDDHLTKRKPIPALPPLDFAQLRRDAVTRMAENREKHAGLIRKNGLSMDHGLVGWITNGVHRKRRAPYRYLVALARQKILPNGRINEEGAFPPLPRDIADRCNEHLETQQRLDTQLEESIHKDREAYLKLLNDRLERARSERLLDQLAGLEKEVAIAGEAGKDHQAFLKYLSGEGIEEE